MKRREIVVEQREPWGPIVARATTAEERAAAGRTGRGRRRAARRVAGVVRVTDDRSRRPRPWRPSRAAAAPSPRRRAAADRADRGRPRGAPVRRRAAARPARDRRAWPASTGRPWTRASATSRSRCASAASACSIDGDRVELATAADGGALVARYVGADAVRLSPASLETLSIVAYRQPVTKSAIERIRGVDSDYTIRTLVHRRLVVELGRSDAPGRPFLYGTGFEFLERFGLTSLDELPPLDVDVASRLAEEGGEAMTGRSSRRSRDAPGAAGTADPPAAGHDRPSGSRRSSPRPGVASRRASEVLIATGTGHRRRQGRRARRQGRSRSDRSSRSTAA